MYVCMTAFQESGTMILSMDALFGLPRKKSAGNSYRDALHGDLDEYVASNKTKKIYSASAI